jgi:hypothetical protein
MTLKTDGQRRLINCNEDAMENCFAKPRYAMRIFLFALLAIVSKGALHSEVDQDLTTAHDGSSAREKNDPQCSVKPSITCPQGYDPMPSFSAASTTYITNGSDGVCVTVQSKQCKCSGIASGCTGGCETGMTIARDSVGRPIEWVPTSSGLFRSVFKAAAHAAPNTTGLETAVLNHIKQEYGGSLDSRGLAMAALLDENCPSTANLGAATADNEEDEDDSDDGDGDNTPPPPPSSPTPSPTAPPAAPIVCPHGTPASTCSQLIPENNPKRYFRNGEIAMSWVDICEATRESGVNFYGCVACDQGYRLSDDQSCVDETCGSRCITPYNQSMLSTNAMESLDEIYGSECWASCDSSDPNVQTWMAQVAGDVTTRGSNAALHQRKMLTSEFGTFSPTSPISMSIKQAFENALTGPGGVWEGCSCSSDEFGGCDAQSSVFSIYDEGSFKVSILKHDDVNSPCPGYGMVTPNQDFCSVDWYLFMSLALDMCNPHCVVNGDRGQMCEPLAVATYSVPKGMSCKIGHFVTAYWPLMEKATRKAMNAVRFQQIENGLQLAACG